jgi:hypothetical protein
MKVELRSRVISAVLCLSLVVLAVPQAHAFNAPPPPPPSGMSGAEIAGITIGAVVFAASVTYLFLHYHGVSGCVVSTPGGLALQNAKGKQTYLLTGDTSGLKAGERVRVRGTWKDVDLGKSFNVSKEVKDYGACK